MRFAVAVLLGVALLGASAGTVAVDEPAGTDARLVERWVRGPAEPLALNHHTPDATRHRGESYVVVPVNSQQGDVCRLLVLDGAGDERWRDDIPPERCNVHSYTDPRIADYDADGEPEVLVPTSNRTLNVYDLATGRMELRYRLGSYGFVRPMVGNVTGGSEPETVVVDLLGNVSLLRPGGETVWTRRFGDSRVREPALADLDADGAPEIPVGQLTGGTVVLDADGSVAWRRSPPDLVTSKWMVVGQADDDPAREVLRASYRGHVLALDGRNGTTEWRRRLSPGATVHALGDGDRDGQAEVYVATRRGVLVALDAGDGGTEWRVRLTGNVSVAPPPALGDLDGDGDPELVAPGHHGRVRVLDPATGDVVATYRRDADVHTFPRVVDFDGDGRDEVLVTYEDGRVVALEYAGS